MLAVGQTIRAQNAAANHMASACIPSGLMYPEVSQGPADKTAPLPVGESSSWRAFANYQKWVMAAAAIVVIPSGIAAIGGVALNGGHALAGPLAVAVDAVLVISLTTGLVVLWVGFKRFLSAQSRARRLGDLKKKPPDA
jgi:hypothetical protein